LRMLGIGILGLIFLSVAVWFLSFAFRTAFYGGGYGGSNDSVYYSEQAMKGITPSATLSMRNVAYDEAGNVDLLMDEEDFEVTEYSSTIKTAKFESTCDKVEGLKALEYVIFTSSNKNERNCNYTFKVKNENADEILEVIKGLKPETLNANKYTLKNVIDDYTSEIDIQTKKLESIEKTLTDAQEAYDDVTVMATRNQDVESLAKIIDSKIQLIERLTKERIDTKEKIDRLNRTKTEQTDRINYTMFSVGIYDVVILDVKQIKDSWIYELKRFVQEFNGMIQSITVGLATYLLKLIQIVIYLLIALFVVKYGWRFTRYIWRK
ncbi:hypothetical protein KKC45_02335, partial [Patescibacteria group bacterium]|nr:hypothetical protein [Patescibacteria group bacterium]